jgi:hypothetical protein
VETRNDLPAIALGGLATVAVSLVFAPFRTGVGGANVALILVLVIIAAAAAGGRRAGITTSLVAALAFNFLHTQPYLSLRIDGPQDIVTFVLLIVVGLATGQLAHLAARRGRDAKVRTEGIAGLHELSQLVTARASSEVVIDRATVYLVRELHLAGCEFHWGDDAAAPPDLDHRGVLQGTMRHTDGGFELPEGGVSLPVRDRDLTVVGRFVLEPRPRQAVTLVDRKLAVLVADLVGPALVPIP